MASSYEPTRRALGDVFGNPDYVRGWTDAKRKALATIKRSEKRPPAVGGVPFDAEPLFERHLYCRACEQHIWVRAPDGIYLGMAWQMAKAGKRETSSALYHHSREDFEWPVGAKPAGVVAGAREREPAPTESKPEETKGATA